MERLFQNKIVYQFSSLEYLTLDTPVLEETRTTEGSPHCGQKLGLFHWWGSC